MPSQEFLEELWAEAKQYLPGWLYAPLFQTARARAGGKVKGKRAAEAKEALQPTIPTTGPKEASIAFVTTAPTKVEVARKELFVGQAGAIFNKSYLQPLNLKREDVLMMSVVPEFAEEPDADTVLKWSDWCNAELETNKPQIVVALGKSASYILGDKCDFVLPHPQAIYKFKDSGEVGRKLKQIKLSLEQSVTKSLVDWKDTWNFRLPQSGSGQFVFNQNELLFEGEDSIWGFAYKSAVEAQVFPIFKEIKKAPKFGNLDKGRYELGIVKENNIEIFLDGEHLNGRYSIQSAPDLGDHQWLIEKSDDQKPSVDTANLADTISELRRTNQKFLFWGKPGEHEFYDVCTGKVIKQSTVKITKADDVKRIIYGVVIDPYGLKGHPDVDAHNDWMPPSEIEKSSHDYMKTSRVIGLQHSTKAEAKVVESWVEQYPNRNEYLKAMQGKAHKINRRKFGDDYLHSGAWVLGVELGKAEWELFEKGKINAFSPGGFGMRKPLVPSQMPEVSIIDLVERRAS
jgi:uracil-DNA glycosylase family 4